ncbi:MAG: DUF2341 domain-containing protein [Candidatus Omnitrophota bacterium]
MKKLGRLTGTVIKSAMVLIMIMMLWVGCARAEVMGFTSAVIWRADDEGDLVIPDARGGICETREGFSTEGRIRNITASWRSEGEVKLEISADAGRNYYKITNGVPLTQEFLTGDRIKWRAYLGAKSALTEVTVRYTDSFNITAGFGEPELSGFKYRKRIDITGGDTELYNYQVKIKIGESVMSKGSDAHCEGNLRKNFNDIRFTSFDGETLIPYYLEKISGNTPERVAEFWIKAPVIPTEGISIYVYYSNLQAESLSSAESVFEKTDGTTDSTLKRKYADVEPVVVSVASGEWRVARSGAKQSQLDEIAAGPSVPRNDKMGTVPRNDGVRQEEVEMAGFRGTTLAPNGDIVLKDGYDAGEYISIKANSAFPVRILVPSMEAEGTKIDISADGGESYKENSRDNNYYYASRGDFSIGTKPVIRARLEKKIERAKLKKFELDYEPGSITVISPNGGEEWIAGTTRDILWSALEYDFFYPVKIEYSTNGGMVYGTITEKTDNDGIYSWKIPGEIGSREVMIRVSDANDEDVNDVSDRGFGIKM